MRLQRIVDLSPGAAAFHPHRLRSGIYLDLLHGRQIDHQAVVAHREARDVMTRAADCDEHLFLAREVDRADHIVRSAAPGYQGRMTIDRDVEYLPCRLVPGVAGHEQFAAESRPQTLDGGGRKHGTSS